MIHEGRLIYPQLGYKLILDIGAWWSEETHGLPLPLGGMVIRRSLGIDVIATANRVIRRSIEHALNHRDEAIYWLLERGSGPLQTYDAVDQYLKLYANDDSVDYGPGWSRCDLRTPPTRRKCRHSQVMPSSRFRPLFITGIDKARSTHNELISGSKDPSLNRFSIDFYFGQALPL